MTTLEQKASISLFSATIFTIVNLPQTYNITNSILEPLTGPLIQGNCPTHIGLLIHTFVFGLIVFLTMGDPRKDTLLKVKYSLYGSLIFFVLSSPSTYSVVGRITGTSSPNGCPSITGILFHAFVYFLALIGLMYLPSDRN